MRENEQLTEAMKRTSPGSVVETISRAAKLSVTALLVAAATTTAVAATMPARADAADVPIYSVCHADNQTGWYQWQTDASGNFSDYIEINDCALQRLGAGPNDRERVIAHEMGHASGLSHSSNPSDIMYPTIPIYGN